MCVLEKHCSVYIHKHTTAVVIFMYELCMILLRIVRIREERERERVCDEEGYIYRERED